MFRFNKCNFIPVRRCLWFYPFFIILMQACTVNRSNTKEDSRAIHLITLAPGHFHAALLQKVRYSQVDPTVYVFAPDGPELRSHLRLIDRYNTRADDPT